MKTMYDKTSNIIYLSKLRRRERRERLAWGLEVCACLSVILMAAAFALRVLV